MKAWGDLAEIKTKSPGASGLSRVFEALGRTVNCRVGIKASGKNLTPDQPANQVSADGTATANASRW